MCSFKSSIPSLKQGFSVLSSTWFDEFFPRNHFPEIFSFLSFFHSLPDIISTSTPVNLAPKSHIPGTDSDSWLAGFKRRFCGEGGSVENLENHKFSFDPDADALVMSFRQAGGKRRKRAFFVSPSSSCEQES